MVELEAEIIAIIDRPNLASSKLAEKLGMRFERELDFGYKTPDCYRIILQAKGFYTLNDPGNNLH